VVGGDESLVHPVALIISNKWVLGVGGIDDQSDVMCCGARENDADIAGFDFRPDRDGHPIPSLF